MQTQKKVVLLTSNPKPALDLDFSKTPQIDSRLTFARSTTGTVVDFEGLVKTAKVNEVRFTGARRVENLLPNTSFTTGWTATNLTVATGIADPLGGTTGARLTATAGNAELYKTIPAFGVASSALSTVYIRRVSGTGAIRFYNPATTGFVDVAAQLTSSYKRFTYGQVSLSGVSVPYFDLVIVTNGDVIEVAFPTMENVTGQANQNPSEYVSVGVLSAPWQGAGKDGVQYFTTTNGNTVSSNVVTEAAGTPLTNAITLLAEGARTNLCLQSEGFSSATWVKDNVTVTANSIAGPDGVATADTLTASSVNGTVLQTITSASSERTFSVYLKRKTGTGTIQLTVDEGTTWVTVAITSSWVRYSMYKAGITNPRIGIRIVTNGDAIYADATQLENNPNYSSYIPTTTVALTRAADVASFTGAGLSWYNSQQGTFAITASGSAFKAPSDFGAFALTYASQTKYTLSYNNSVKNGSTYLYTAATLSNPTEYTSVAVPTTIYVNAAGIANISRFTYYPKALKLNKMAALL
jgi:hypothetical protein